MSRDQAERDARVRLGNPSMLSEAHAESRGFPWLERCAADIRYAVRGLHRNPRFAWSAIVTAAVAIGTATAVFSVVDRTLFRPLPYGNGDRLVSIGIHAPVIAPQDWLFAGTYREWKRELRLPIEALGAWKGVNDCDRNDGTPERLGCLFADRDFLDVLGVTPALGRNLTDTEDEPGAAPVALLSHGYWHTRFGADPAIVGRVITLDGALTRIVGVLPPDFRTPTLVPAEIVRPLQLRRQGQMQRVIHGVGRLTPGATPEAAHAALLPLFQRFTGSAPPDFRQAVPMQLRVPGLQHQQTAAYRAGLLMLFGSVLAFVLMSCANVASLLLARSEARRHEFAVRASLGASAGRLMAQTVTESLVLGLAAGITGCGIAWALLDLFGVLAPTFTSRFGAAHLDWRVLAFALLLTLISVLLFGFAPALDRRRGENLTAPRVAGPRSYYLRSLFTSAQFAVSVVLLTLTGLFSVSLWKLQTVDLGFRPDQAVTASFVLPEQHFNTEGEAAIQRQIAFFNALEARIRSIPGLDAVAITDSLPPGGDPRSFPWVALDRGGGDASAKGKEGLVKWRFVTEDFLAVLDISLKHGRGFSAEDRSSGPQAVIVNETFALRRFGRTDVVGEGVYCAQCVIVGVARDVRNSGLRVPATPEMWVLRRNTPNDFWRNQRPPFGWRAATVVARSPQDPRLIIQALERVIHEAQPGMPLIGGKATHQLDEYLEQPRFQTAILMLFAITGLGLAAVGLYGLTSYLATARTREMGVRMALGASRGHIVALLLRGGMVSTGGGIMAGTLVALAVIQVARSAIAELQASDARVLPAVLLVLAVAAIAGAGLPGLRASRTDPAQALRHD